MLVWNDILASLAKDKKNSSDSFYFPLTLTPLTINLSSFIASENMLKVISKVSIFADWSFLVIPFLFLKKNIKY